MIPAADLELIMRGLNLKPAEDASPAAPATWRFPVYDGDGYLADLVPVDPQSWGRLTTARLMAPQLARHFDLDINDVLTALDMVSVNVLALLDCPQGWSVVADFVRVTAGGSERPGTFVPTVN